MQEHVKTLSECIVDLQGTRDKSQPNLNAINTLSEKIVAEERLTVINRVIRVL